MAVAPDTSTSSDLTYGRIFQLYWPLALSWTLMAVEMPIALYFISRMPANEIQTAALQIVMAISIFVESPVIDLLSTSTALSKNRSHYLTLRRFVFYLMVWVTVVHAIIAFTPLYWVVTLSPYLLNLDPVVAEAARLPLMIMTTWSAFIAWRRYSQGILIRAGVTRPISVGTAVRATVILVVVGGLYWRGGIPGATVAGVALALSAAVESIFIHFVTRPIVARRFDNEDQGEEDAGGLSMGRLFKFHAPLAAATAVMLLAPPAVSFALARLPNPVVSLGAWQAASSIIFLFRTFTMALPEAVIALYKQAADEAVLRKFCSLIGGGMSLLMMLMVLTPLDTFVFTRVFTYDAEFARVAGLAILFSFLLPFLNAQMSFLRGMLTVTGRTVARFMAILVAVGSLILFLRIGLETEVLGVTLTLAMIAEMVALQWMWSRHRRRQAA
ncbi:MAG: hypothetical protein ACOCX1_05145 [Fimbriimonadaceae bacterium]